MQVLLAKLKKRLDEPISWELKRNLIEVLVAGVRIDVVETGGVRQSATTVTYRFIQPDQPIPLFLPQSHGEAVRLQMPLEPKTVGDHIRRRRLTLKLLQRDVASQLGVDKASIYNWETNRTKPGIEYMPAIIQFLGCNPLPPSGGWADRLVQGRTAQGLSLKSLRFGSTSTPVHKLVGNGVTGSLRVHSLLGATSFLIDAGNLSYR